MNLFTSLLPYLLILLTLSPPSLGAKSTATSFCKCICFNNSTIIALNPPSTTQRSSPHSLDIRSPHADPFYPYSEPHAGSVATTERDAAEDAGGENEGDKASSRPHHKLACADCTRAFCLEYNLPICKNARDEDVFTTCFQRDSLKDETVVVIFIFATAGLLGWALVTPWIDRLRERNSFVPLPQHDHHAAPAGARASAHPNADVNAKHFRRTGGPGGSGTGAGISGRDGPGGASGSASRSGRGDSPSALQPDLDMDMEMHADQDAVDIVSDVPSSSSSRPRP